MHPTPARQGHFVSEETVTVLIYRLRRKLEQSGLSGSAIETVTGAGYRLVQAE